MFENADLTSMSRTPKIQANQPTAGLDMAPRYFLPRMRKYLSPRVANR